MATGSYYELYRGTTIGITLADTLDMLVNTQAVTPQLASKVIHTFDQVVAQVLNDKVRAKMNVKGHLDVYNLCDEVYTFVIKDMKVKLDNAMTIEVEDRVKMVACQTKP